MYIYVYAIILILILLNCYLDYRYKNNFKKENFPKNIIQKLDETITLPDVIPSKETPKKIYRCHRDKESIAKYQSVFDQTQKLMPEYEQIIYDNNEVEEFIKNNYSDRIYKSYLAINPLYGPARSDFFRMLIIYLKGGVYFDIKSGPSSSKINGIINKNQGKILLSTGENIPYSLIPYRHFLPFKEKGYHNWSFVTNTIYNEYAQWFIIAGKGNKLIGDMIKQMVSNIEYGIKNPKAYNKGCYSVLACTGPICFSKIISRNYSDPSIKIITSSYYLKHSLIDYKKIEKNKHYESLEEKNVIL